MVKSKAKEVTPHGTVHLMKWVWKQTSQGVKDFDRGYEDQGSINPMRLPQGQRKKWKKTMAMEFRTQDYLDILLEQDAPPRNHVCSLCDGDGMHKCRDCISQPIFCTKCCQMQHSLLPFHRISQWNGDFFERSTLTKIGVQIHLGHGGRPCPSAASRAAGNMGLYGGAVQDVDETGGDVFTEADYAANAKDLPEDKQMFEMGMFPASFTRPKTAFTFTLLNDFILDNLECGTLAMNYYSKLRRITSSAFPHLVLDRYQELMRVARQWRQLKLLKWNGFGHNRGDPKDGKLALFCPVCPQPGINVILPTKYDDARPGWLYARSLVMDGNFKAKHLHPVHPEDEVWLTDGKCFMSGEPGQHMSAQTGSNGHRGLRMCKTRVARIDREIMETLWVPLNVISPSAQGMSTPHRQECLNYQMNDCNFMKMIRMGLFLSQKYKEAKQGIIEISRAFNELNDAADPDMVDQWEIQEMTAQAARINDPSTLNVYDIQLHKVAPAARSWKEVELDLLQTSFHRPGARPQLGAAMWLASGITIEEMQIALAIETRKMGGHPTETQTLEIGCRRIRLQHTIDKFIAGAARYLGGDFDEDDCIPDMDIDFIVLTFVLWLVLYTFTILELFGNLLWTLVLIIFGPSGASRSGPFTSHSNNANSNDEDSEDDPTPGRNRQVLFQPERVVIPLPSNLGAERCEALGIGDLVRQEITLREGQANDMLHAIRVHLANEAVLFRTTVRLAKSQATTTRAWLQVHSVEWVINLNSTIYKKCRAQLLNLGADKLLEKYRELHKSNLKATSARNSTLPWFWSLDVQGDLVSNDWMNEFDVAQTAVYRVHWLHTKALRDRWAEELLLVGHEMHWTINFLVHKAQMWLDPTNQNGRTKNMASRWFILAALSKVQLHCLPVDQPQPWPDGLFVQHLIWEVEKFIFPFINICATSNTSPALLEYLNMKMLTEWQVGLLDGDRLFQKFWSSEFNLAGDHMARYRMVLSFSYSWWKDRFDTMPFEMPDRLSLEEVWELYQAHMEQMLARYLLLPDMSRRKGGSDPLLANLRALRDDLEEFSDHLQTWLSKKTDEGRIALEAMARLEGPVDALHDAMAASQQFLDSGRMQEDEE
ncbi:hypothetical protein BDR05DRAFT_949739 [Suillus weaverae]|nr:hypothetical protein BDR05DRAFT_949739 [Suillus weaverae]